jgi:hypothetical protein
MVQDASVAHGTRGLDAQPVDDGAYAFGCGQPLKRQSLNRDIVDFSLNSGGAVGFDFERRRLEVRADARLAADRSAFSRNSRAFASCRKGTP